MDIRLQAKLLQVLQDQEFRRLGGTDVVRVNVRVIAATHRDLLEAIRLRTFREDLYYRLNIFTLALPPLRDRREDILSLAEFLIGRHSSPDTPPVSLTPSLQNALRNFAWPGNIRQLENVVRKFIVLRDPDLIAAELERLGQGSGEAETGSDPDVEAPRRKEPGSVLQEVSRVKEEAEVEAILEALHRSRWNRKQAAVLLDIDYKALLYKMKKLSIQERADKVPLTA
jgi:two-component system response regulator AtoC